MSAKRRLKDWLAARVPPIRWAHLHWRGQYAQRLIQVRQWVRNSVDLAARYDFADMAFRDGRAYIITQEGCELLYQPDLPYSGLNMELKEGSFEASELSLLKNLCSESSVILDIGANAGYFSIALAKRFPQLAVHAFEPIPATFDALSHNCFHNGVQEQVHCNRSAVGSTPGTLRMTSTLNTGNFVLQDCASSGRQGVISVPVTTVDRYLGKAGLTQVDGIKCDVEGAELLVLRGAGGCLTSSRPWLLLEIDGRWLRRQQTTPSEVAQFLQERGYDRWVFTERGLREGTHIEQDIAYGYNFLFLHSEASSERLIEAAQGRAA